MIINKNLNRSSILEQKQIEAAEKIWHFVIKMTPLHILGEFSKTIDLKELRKRAFDGIDASKHRAFADKILEISGANKIVTDPEGDPSARVKLFIDGDVWEKFSIYRTMLFDPYVAFQAARLGAPIDTLKDNKQIIEDAKRLLPAHANYLDIYGKAGLPYLYDEMEKLVLEALRKSIGSPLLKDVVSAEEIINEVENFKNRSEIATPPELRSNTPPPSH